MTEVSVSDALLEQIRQREPDDRSDREVVDRALELYAELDVDSETARNVWGDDQ